ncbi:HTH-type transcriptional regulator CynR [Marinomonas spartinae]|uniref:LysR family transcriptional regulator n=1 Tax=Marinomonas spartinae TaxID=1792290 RepID=UPI000808FF38|nr:LysR family transcriptional regulator [Marinomonas spartinae]SBS36036.1 HTH-type transcriptional regulator CynR [Marinomonas spartinae]
MDIKQLKFLLALEQTRHFGKAAELCHVTQPTLSMRISNLEEELGLELVVRGHRFEGFSEPGLRILAWAKTLLATHDGLLAEAANCRGKLVGNLSIGMVPLSCFDPTRLLKPLSQRYPELTYSLSSLSSEAIIDQLMRNQLDLGICYIDEVDQGQFDIIDLGITQMGLMYSGEFFQFDSEEVEWEEVIEKPLGLLDATMSFRQSITHILRNLHLTPNVILESDSSYHLIQAVASGLCCTIMPMEEGIEALSDNLKLKPIKNGLSPSQIGLIIRKSVPRSALAEQCFKEATELFTQQPLLDHDSQ